MSEYIVHPNSSMFVRPMEFLHTGQVRPGHDHKHDHTFTLPKGRVKVTARASEDGPIVAQKIVDAKNKVNWLFVDKKLWHEIECLEPVPSITFRMRDAALAAAPGVDVNTVLAIIEASQKADVGAMGNCMYSHRVPQAIAQHEGKNDEYDALLKKLIGMADELFGQVVLTYSGWDGGYQ